MKVLDTIFVAAAALVVCIGAPVGASAGEPADKSDIDMVAAQGEAFANAAELSTVDRESFLKHYVPYLRELKQHAKRRCEVEKQLFAAFKSQPVATQEVDRLLEELTALDRNEVEQRRALHERLARDLPRDRAALLVLNDRTRSKRAVVCQ